MFCQQCGSEMSEGSKFCTTCGAPVKTAENAQPVSDNTGFIPTPPVSENTGYIPKAAPQETYAQQAQPAQPTNNYAQQAAPAAAPVYAQPAYGNAPAPAAKPAKRTLTRWPSSIGTMGVISLVFFMAALVMLFLHYREDLYMTIADFSRAYIIDLLLAIAVPVLFFVHTRKLAFLTAIPMVISLVFTGIYTFRDFRYLDSVSLAQNLVLFFFELLLVIFYILQMTIRPRNAALSILYLIFTILELILLAIFVIIFIDRSYASGYLIIYRILNYISSIFLSVTYIMAMFRSRKG